MTESEEILVQAPNSQLNNNVCQTDDNQITSLHYHSIGNSSASSASSSSLSPPYQSSSTPIQNAPQTTSPCSTSLQPFIDNNSKQLNLQQPNLINSDSKFLNVSNNIPKSESVTPINSRFIIKKIPQSELEKYKNTPTHKSKNSHTSDSKNSSSIQVSADQIGENSSSTSKNILPDTRNETNSQTILEPLKTKNNERRINKFTVKKVKKKKMSLLFSKFKP